MYNFHKLLITIFFLQRDGTFNTKSQLVFQASHYENGIKIHCYAENEVTKHKGEPEGHKVLILEVRCKFYCNLFYLCTYKK